MIFFLSLPINLANKFFNAFRKKKKQCFMRIKYNNIFKILKKLSVNQIFDISPQFLSIFQSYIKTMLNTKELRKLLILEPFLRNLLMDNLHSTRKWREKTWTQKEWRAFTIFNFPSNTKQIGDISRRIVCKYLFW